MSHAARARSTTRVGVAACGLLGGWLLGCRPTAVDTTQPLADADTPTTDTPAADTPAADTPAADLPATARGCATRTTLAASGSTVVSFSVAPPLAEAHRTYLGVEGVTASVVGAGIYQLYLNLPAGASPADHPELAVGGFPMYGVIESSRDGGTGVGTSYDVTTIVAAAARTQAPQTMTITFVPEPWPAGGPQGDASVRRVCLHQVATRD